MSKNTSDHLSRQFHPVSRHQMYCQSRDQSSIPVLFVDFLIFDVAQQESNHGVKFSIDQGLDADDGLAQRPCKAWFAAQQCSPRTSFRIQRTKR